MLVVEPIEIVKVIRRMRGGSQSFLVRGSDGRAYVAKFTGNPQGNRTLINECIAGHLLSALHVATPDLAVLRLTDSCQGREQLYCETDRQQPIRNGLHLGSKCPVNPERTVIFDLLPRQLQMRVGNTHDAGVVFAFDRWAAHVDTRQFVFARSRKAGHSVASGNPKACLTAWAIDNGMCFGGDWRLRGPFASLFHQAVWMFPHWDLAHSSLCGAKMIEQLPAATIRSSHQDIPRDWFGDGDEEALAVMLDALQCRQGNAVTMIQEQISTAGSKVRLAV